MATSSELVLEDVLARTIAAQIPGSGVLPKADRSRRPDGPAAVVFPGEVGFCDCFVSDVSVSGTTVFAAIYLSLTFDGLADGTPILATAMGSGEAAEAAVAAGGTQWAQAFLPVLFAGIGRSELVQDQHAALDEFEVEIAGQLRRVVVGHLDKWAGSTAPEMVAAARAEAGGVGGLTRRVIDSAIAIPESSCVVAAFVGLAEEVLAEVKINGEDDSVAMAALAAIPARTDGSVVLLRELAVISAP